MNSINNFNRISLKFRKRLEFAPSFRTNKWHFVFWSIYFLFCFLTDLVFYSTTTFWTELLFFTTNNLYLFYTMYLFITFCNFKTIAGTVKSTTMLFLIVGIFLGIRYLIRFEFLAKHIDSSYGDVEFIYWLVKSIVWVVNYVFFASAYYYFKSSLRKQEHIKHFREEQLIQEKKILQMENTILRTQINPHVLYNTLNFLYAKSLPVSEELSNGILTLSEIMQYSLKNQDSNGLVLLSDELEHVQNIVELARLKSNNKTHINVEFEQVDQLTTIVPLLLVTLVENIFKHADVSDPTQPAQILLSIEPGEILRFIVANKPRNTSFHQPGTHIGLSNARSRFEKEYGDQGEMKVIQSENLFQIELRIPIRKRSENSNMERLVA